MNKKAYWLFKSEPITFSIDHLKNSVKGITSWEGVRNFQVRNLLRDHIKIGDYAFFYHSNCVPPGIVGSMQIIKAGYPDPSAYAFQSKYYDPKGLAEKPRWFMVDVKFITKFKRMITLDEIKHHPFLQNMPVARRGNRLSITPVTPEEWKIICNLSGG